MVDAILDTQLKASQSFSKVAVWTLRIHFDAKIEPLSSVLVLPCVEMATSSVIDATIVFGINLNPGKVVVKCYTVSVWAYILGFCLAFLMTLIQPEFCTFENVLVV